MEKKDFGNYELHERLGKGAMGWVFGGIKKQLELPVAVKIPFPQFSEEEEFRQRFQQEARSMARMNHENVVRVIDFGDHEGTPFIVMEFLEGSDLRIRLDRDGFPPIEIALLLILDICRGLEHAHSKDIVHRDLKPSNVMFTANGVCKLMDFGLARRRDEGLHLTRTGVVLGTTPYMSPEQTRALDVDHRSDIFSLGVICYELLGGERPFQGDSSTAIMNAILHHTPRPLDVLDPLVPEQVTRVIGQMLEKERDDRPSTVTEIRREMDMALVELQIPHARELLARYATDPLQVSRELREARLAQCLDRARAFTGPEGVDAALRHYRSALYLDPKNREAGSAVKKLERESARRRPEPSEPVPAPPEPETDTTLVLPPPAIASDAAPSVRVRAQTVTVAPAPGPPAQDPPKKKADGPSRSRERSTPAIAPPSPPRPVHKEQRESARVFRLLVIAGSALIAIVVVVTAIAIQRGFRPAPKERAPVPSPAMTPRSALRIGTVPSGALVSVDGAAGVPAPFDAGELTPGIHVLTATLDGYQTRTDTITFVAGSDSMVTLALLPVTSDSLPGRPGPGSITDVPLLVVRTTPPGATVTVGSRAPRSSPARFSRVPAGRVPLRIRANGYAPLDTVVRLAVGRDTTLRFALAALRADSSATAKAPSPQIEAVPAGKSAFTFRAWPWADVYVDGKLVLTKADTAQVAVAAGKHAVEFRHPDYETVRQSVRFKDGQTERLYAAFYLQKGWITVTTADNGPCTVFIDGQAMPAPAPALYEVKPGRHRVRAERQGVAATEGEKLVRLRKNDRVKLTFGFVSPATAR